MSGVLAAEQPSCAATVLLSAPSAHPSTTRERSASACEDFLRRAQRTNWPRSSSVSVSSALGRPVRGIPQPTTYQTNLGRRTLGPAVAPRYSDPSAGAQ